MKHKVSELEGEPFDAAVSKCLGFEVRCIEDSRTRKYEILRRTESMESWVSPTHVDRNMAIGIIERERISVGESGRAPDEWSACYGRGPRSYGQTMLIAAMRAFVASKFGAEVELP